MTIILLKTVSVREHKNFKGPSQLNIFWGDFGYKNLEYVMERLESAFEELDEIFYIVCTT